MLAIAELAQAYLDKHEQDPNYLAFHPDDGEARKLVASVLKADDVYVIESDGVPSSLMAIFRYEDDGENGAGGDGDDEDEVVLAPEIIPSKPGVIASAEFDDDRPYLSNGEYVSVASLEPDEIIAAVHDALALWREKNPNFPEPRHVGLPNNLSDEAAARLEKYFAENADIYPWWQPSTWRVGVHNVGVGINMR